MFSVKALDVSNTFFREATIPARGEGRSAMVCAGGPVPPREGPTAKKDEKPDKRGQLGERINSAKIGKPLVLKIYHKIGNIKM